MLSPYSPSVGEQSGGGAARQGFLDWARSSCGPCQGVLSNNEAEAVLVSGCLKLIISIERRGRGEGEWSLWELTLSCQTVAFGACTNGWSLQEQGRRRLRGNPNSVSGVQPGSCHFQEDFLQIFQESDWPCFQLGIPVDQRTTPTQVSASLTPPLCLS